MQVTFPVTTTIPSPPVGFQYVSLSATFILTINGSSQTFNGLSAAAVTYSPNTGTGVPPTTDVGFDPAAGQGGPPWIVMLQGSGNLLPNGLTPTLPPLSAWALAGVPSNVAMHYDYIAANGQFYQIDTFGPCSSSGAGSGPSASDLDKSLGNPKDAPGCPVCGDLPSGDPIGVGTGNMFEEVADYRTSGANPLGFTRYYNSMGGSNTFATTLGTNWRSNYDRYLRIVSASSVTAERADGQQVNFTLTSGAWTTDTDVDIKLTNSGSSWTLTDTHDTVETYSVAAGASEGLLQTIRARNGYTQTLQYASGNQLASVGDSYHRQLSLAYSGGKLQTVTTPDGLILTYGYTGALLTSVGYSTTPPTRQTYVYENTALPSALTGVIDENGNRYSTWTYDPKGRALTTQHAGGAGLITFTYNDTDSSRTVTNALGEQEVYKFRTLQGIPKVTEIDRTASATLPAATRKFTYDTNGYKASETDWNGNVTNYVNDAHGQVTSMTEAAGTPQARTITATYLSDYRLPSQIVTPGLTFSFTYDANGELLTQKLTDTTTTTVPYSTAGQTRTWTYTWSNFLLASVQSPRTDVKGLTTFTYDSSGALTEMTNALGQTTQIAQRLPGGLPQSMVDPNGVTASFTYDARLRLLSGTVMTAAGPLTTSYSYDRAGNPIGVALPDGSALANTYDAAHRLTAVTDLFNQSISNTLDAKGDRTQSSVADASGTLQHSHSGKFDALGRLLQNIGGAGQTTSYAYDSNGNALTVTDPLGHAAHQAYDALNRLIAVTDPAGSVTATSYDARNRPISVTDPNGGVTTYVYDGFGDMIQRVSPDSGTTVYRYDLDGDLTQSVNGAGAVANYTYDALGRVITASYPADAAENVTYTYDQGSFGIGRLTGVADAAGTLARSYDERGNLLGETRTNGSATLITTYTYDAASRLASVTYPSGWTAAYTRDMMGRVTAVTAQAAGAGASVPVLAGVAYQPFGPVNALTFGNGVAETRGFDLDYRLSGLADTGTAALQSLTYAYDAANNVLSITDGVTAGNSQSFGYDKLNRLASASGGYGSFSYTYDSVGNRMSEGVGGAPTTYAYAAKSNQLSAVTAGGVTQPIGYDKAGNVNNNTIYNQAGRLAAVMAGSSPVAQYTYDAFGQRLEKVGAVSGTTFYQYDLGGRLLEESDGQGNPLVDYIYLGSLPVATLSPATGQIYFLHNDRLGTPQLATDSGQNVAWLADYGPFGEMSAVPAGIVQNLRMPGQEFDVDTGLYHNGFRDYNPAWGRYLQSDPAGLAAGVNTYTYAEGNPAQFTDRLGLAPAGAATALASQVPLNFLYTQQNACLAAGFQPFVCAAPNNNETAAWAAMEQRTDQEALFFAAVVPVTFAATLSFAVDGLTALGYLTLGAADAADVAGVAQLVPVLSAASLELKAMAGELNPFDFTPSGDVFGTVGDILSVALPGEQGLLKLATAAPGVLKDAYDYFKNVFGADSTTPACPNAGK
jgi:RHS repeat-associated protein